MLLLLLFQAARLKFLSNQLDCAIYQTSSVGNTIKAESERENKGGRQHFIGDTALRIMWEMDTGKSLVCRDASFYSNPIVHLCIRNSSFSQLFLLCVSISLHVSLCFSVCYHLLTPIETCKQGATSGRHLFTRRPPRHNRGG